MCRGFAGDLSGRENLVEYEDDYKIRKNLIGLKMI